ncbi:MAG: AMP-binding protein, partial [bacterium]|nr:AMP-binding protein [bacterium]
KPKGAMVEHLGMQNHMQAKVCDLNIASKTIVAQNASHTFDISVWQMFVALIKGGKTVIFDNELVLNHTKLLEEVVGEVVTLLEVVPSYLSVILGELETVSSALPVEYLLVTGEEIKVELVNRWFRKYPQIKMVNAYGPTEASDDITHYIMEKSLEAGQLSVPIGKPLQNFDIYIVDKYMKLLPVGIKGELCVAGDGVGRGYLNNPEQTAKSFVKDGWQSIIGSRQEKKLTNKENTSSIRYPVSSIRIPNNYLYRTGDLAQWYPDGNVQFLGRLDYQVKVRGFRIELGEIERRLLTHGETKEAVVLANEDNTGEKYLCAYVVVTPNSQATQQLKDYLSRYLPNYMIPSFFIELEQIPLTANGKIDRKALTKLEISNRNAQTGQKETGDMAGDYTPPRNEIEHKLVPIWAEVLYDTPGKKISIDDDFFRLGGHSLKAAVLISKIHKELESKIPLTQLFKTPTIRGLAQLIQQAARDKYYSVEPVEKKDYYPMSPAQKRIYILQQIEIQSTAYNMPELITLDDITGIDLGILEKNFEKIIARHESLRTSFQMLGETPVQVVHNHREIKLSIENYNDILRDNESETQLLGTSHKPGSTLNRLIRPFDLGRAPLLRAVLIKEAAADGKNSSKLFVDMHHIISDGLSIGILQREFMELYKGGELPPLRLQYKEYAEWQNSSRQKRATNRQKEYWLAKFVNEIPVLELPTDYTRPSMQSFDGNMVIFGIGAVETACIIEMGNAEGTTLFVTLLTLFYVLMAKLSAQEDIVVGTPVAGRRHADLDKIIGMFVNTLALRNYPHAGKQFNTFLREVKDETVTALENQEYPFEELVENVAVTRDAGRNPLFDVMCSLQTRNNTEENKTHSHSGQKNTSSTGKIAREQGQPGESYEMEYEHTISKFDLSMEAAETSEGLNFNIEYCTKLFKRETIERFVGYFKRIVEAVNRNPFQEINSIDILTEE